MVWYGMVWYGTVWYGMVWYGMVWYGMVWYGMVWYGMVWYLRPGSEQLGVLTSPYATIAAKKKKIVLDQNVRSLSWDVPIQIANTW